MILVARHARVALQGICYGQSDIRTELSDPEAVDVLVEQLAAQAVAVTRVASSPQRRACGPAAMLATRLGVEHAVDARLCELHFGEWEGRRFADLETEPSFQLWMREWETARPPGGERLSDLVGRVRAWWMEASAEPGVTLAITHAGVIRALRSSSRNVPYAEVMSEEVVPLRVERP